MYNVLLCILRTCFAPERYFRMNKEIKERKIETKRTQTNRFPIIFQDLSQYITKFQVECVNVILKCVAMLMGYGVRSMTQTGNMYLNANTKTLWIIKIKLKTEHKTIKSKISVTKWEKKKPATRIAHRTQTIHGLAHKFCWFVKYIVAHKYDFKIYMLFLITQPATAPNQWTNTPNQQQKKKHQQTDEIFSFTRHIYLEKREREREIWWWWPTEWMQYWMHIAHIGSWVMFIGPSNSAHQHRE